MSSGSSLRVQQAGTGQYTDKKGAMQPWRSHRGREQHLSDSDESVSSSARRRRVFLQFRRCLLAGLFVVVGDGESFAAATPILCAACRISPNWKAAESASILLCGEGIIGWPRARASRKDTWSAPSPDPFDSGDIFALSNISLLERVVAASSGVNLFHPISALTLTVSPIGLLYAASCRGSRSFFSRLFGPIASTQPLSFGVPAPPCSLLLMLKNGLKIKRRL